MPKLTQTVAPTTELELTEAQQLALLTEMKIYEGLVDEMKDAIALVNAMKGELDRMRAQLGTKSVSPADGYIITLVDGGTTKSLDKKALMSAFKITPKQMAGFYVEKPKKAHTLITTPKDVKAKPKAGAGAETDERDDYEDQDE